MRFLSKSGGAKISLWAALIGSGVMVQGASSSNAPYRILKFAGHGGGELSFAPDGQMLIGGRSGGEITLWNSRTGKKLRVINSPGWTRAFDVSPDGRTLVTGSSSQFTGVVRLWNLRTGRFIRILAQTIWTKKDNQPTGLGPVCALRFSPNGRMIAVGSTFEGDLYSAGQPGFGPALLLSARTGKTLCQLHLPHGYSAEKLAFAHDGREIAALCGDDSIRVCSTRTGRVRWTFKRPVKDVLAIGYSPAGRLVTASRQGTQIIIRIVTGRVVRRLQIPKPPVGDVCLVFSKDGKSIAMSQNAPNIHLWHTS